MKGRSQEQQPNVSNVSAAQGRCWAASSLACVVLSSVMGSVFSVAAAARPSPPQLGAAGPHCAQRGEGEGPVRLSNHGVGRFPLVTVAGGGVHQAQR